MTTVADLPRIHADAQAGKAWRKTQRFARPLVRLWDGNWALRGIVVNEISGEFHWLLNEAGVGTLVLPFDHYLAKWAIYINGRTTQNIHITVDRNNSRWDGRLEKAVSKTDEHGVTVVELTFMHSYQELKFVYGWANPALPAILQWPREFILAGPACWTLKTALFCQILRLTSSIWALPDDPMDIRQWFDLDQSTWPIVVAPSDFASDGSLWTVFGSRFKSMHDAFTDTLDFAQLRVTTRRWLTGDPPPWPGAKLRNGCLVVDIIRQDGWDGTASGGNVVTGLIHTAQVLANDFLEQTSYVLPDPDDPAEYRNPGWLGSLPSVPWVVYRPGAHTGIQSSQFEVWPSTAVQMLTGGHSLSMVNELMSAGVQLSVDLAAAAVGGELVGLGAAGQIVDTLVKPLYQDCVSGDTLVHTPNGDRRIDELAATKEPFQVWSLAPDGTRVPAVASIAFRKGRAELFEVVLDDGRTIKTTAQHRVLTSTGWMQVCDAAPGTRVAVVDHDELPVSTAKRARPPVKPAEELYRSLADTGSLAFATVVSVQQVGEADFYDMHVPGWENYSAGGMWHHNTVLAWMSYKDAGRAYTSGWSHYYEHFENCPDKAYTLSSIVTMFAALWKTRRHYVHKINIANGAPFLIGEAGPGGGHFFLGDRIGSTVKGMPPGEIIVERVGELVLAWSRTAAPEWQITVGTNKDDEPLGKAFRMIGNLMSDVHEFGVI